MATDREDEVVAIINAGMRAGENPRWALCRMAIGREPAGREFILWLGSRWQEFADHLQLKLEGGWTPSDRVFLQLGRKEGQRQFDAWLAKGVGAGKWRTV